MLKLLRMLTNQSPYFYFFACGEDLVASSARGDETRRVGLVNLVLVATESKRKLQVN